MRHIFFIGVILTSLTGCIGVGRYTKIVEKGLANRPAVDTTLSRDYITVKSNGIKPLEAIKVETLKSQCIPALVYWNIEQEIRSEYDPYMQVKRFSYFLNQYCDSVNFASRLKGKKLEINVESIPNSFSYSLKSQAFIFGFFYTVMGHEGIIPAPQEFCIRFKVYQDGNLYKGGTYTGKGLEQYVDMGLMSYQSMVNAYFKQNDKSLRKMAELVVKYVDEVI
ncbi:hypothetical protein [uncultured Acetobacteroides sp.]|uniref:hypothetical protein n=1 Tax=uncultured Acetobacteroides sp. TaxID=1760811 RepID=UPI0029F487CF|nr:hypothetical protein [uncultured Acetobacteroides sp.]